MGCLCLDGQRGRVAVGDGARCGLALDVDGDVHGDLLTLDDDDEVEVLDDAEHGVLLDILDEGEALLAVDLELEDRVRLADDEADLVRGERNMLRLGAATVHDGGDLAGGTKLACRALAE